MKKLLIIIVAILILSSLVFAELSDDTLEEVEKLRWKHSEYILMDSYVSVEWVDFYQWNMYFEDGKLFVETQDGKWFIEMEKVK